MLRRAFSRLLIALAAIGLFVSSGALRAQDDDSRHGRKYKAPPLSAHIEVTVLRDSSGKPVHDAHVIFHPIEGDKDKGALEVKTNEDGKTVIDVIPIGDTVRMQIIADGFQTYGQDYKVDKPEISMEVRLKRPTGQYSIYKNSSNGSGTGNNSNSGSGSSDNSGGGKSSGPPPGSNQPQPKSN